MPIMRLDRILSDAGAATRSEAAALIRAGAVTVNGAIAKSGAEKHNTDSAVITLRGQAVTYKKFCYIMMHKPAGVISATEDRKERTVTELLTGNYSRLNLFPAGRLDKDAEGLLILTNDGDYAHRVMSPSKRVFKEYLAVTEGVPTERDIAAFADGIVLADGMKCLPAELKVISEAEECTVLVRICEGKYHQVKRMLASCGCPVRYLKRLAIGGLRLDDVLEPGQFREMSADEAETVFISDAGV